MYVSKALMAGMAAGAVESLTSSPFELIKLRAQVTSASRIPSVTPATKNRVGVPAMTRLLRGYSLDMKALNHSVGHHQFMMYRGHPKSFRWKDMVHYGEAFVLELLETLYSVACHYTN
ncbi:Mitochondrial substrate/solute carrier [Corchorus olitorius]|uniref:Mitochondrial substrate/solute carrier n=1 Tax=Corchorus olitorius TaxID=93759 RepID=A0A1R3KAB9_9ROSI|nr:Mitochondrial substrate/solute carrier [Corchorus olitorius]